MRKTATSSRKSKESRILIRTKEYILHENLTFTTVMKEVGI